MLKYSLLNTKCSDLVIFSPKKYNVSSHILHWIFFQQPSTMKFTMGRLLCLLDNNWFIKISLLLIFLSLVIIQKEIGLYHLGNQGYLFKALSMEFDNSFIIDWRWKEICFWDNEVCAQLDCTVCLDFPLCILETLLVLPRFFFSSQNLERKMRAPWRPWRCS